MLHSSGNKSILRERVVVLGQIYENMEQGCQVTCCW